MNAFIVALLGALIFGAGVFVGALLSHWLTRDAREAAEHQSRFFLDELFSFLKASKLSGGELASITERKLDLQEKQLDLSQMNKESEAVVARMRRQVPLDVEQR